MKTKIIIGVIFIGVLAVSAGFFMYQKPSEKTVSAHAAYAVNAMQLFNEFNDDEPTANQKYLNQVLSVEGRITEISAVDSVGLTVFLETSNPLFGVSCQLPEGDKGRTLKRGDNVRIKGLCTGKLMDVVLVRCVLENQSITIK
jgi:hypothetical protein